MPSPRIEPLIAKLEKGQQKTNEILSALTPEQWARPVYEGPRSWSARDLLAHFLSAEERLLEIAQDVSRGGPGTPAGFDFDAYNAEERQRLQDRSPQELLPALGRARQATLEWVRALDDDQLDHVGRHPALGQITLETMITAIYGHQLLHMRDLQARLTHRG